MRKEKTWQYLWQSSSGPSVVHLHVLRLCRFGLWKALHQWRVSGSSKKPSPLVGEMKSPQWNMGKMEKQNAIHRHEIKGMDPWVFCLVGRNYGPNKREEVWCWSCVNIERWWDVVRDKCSFDDLVFIDVSSTYSNICVVDGIDKLKMELQLRYKIQSSMNTWAAFKTPVDCLQKGLDISNGCVSKTLSRVRMRKQNCGVCFRVSCVSLMWMNAISIMLSKRTKGMFFFRPSFIKMVVFFCVRHA